MRGIRGLLAGHFFLLSLLIFPMPSHAHSPMRQSFLASDGVRLSYLQSGSPKHGTPVLALVTGWSMPASVWRLQLHELSTSFHVVALDPRGQGESEVPSQGYGIDRRADDVREFIQAYPNVVLVGWSLGALESLHMWHRHAPSNIRGLVLVDSSVGEDPPPPSGSTFLNELRSDREATLRRFIDGVFGRSHTSDERLELLTQAQRMQLEDSLQLFPSHLPRTHWREITRQVSVPLMYAVTPQFSAQAQHLKQARPATKIAVFRETGHALFADSPTRFNRLLIEFVNALPVPPR